MRRESLIFFPRFFECHEIINKSKVLVDADTAPRKVCSAVRKPLNCEDCENYEDNNKKDSRLGEGDRPIFEQPA